jgi:hypothetical protein
MGCHEQWRNSIAFVKVVDVGTEIITKQRITSR